MEYDSWEPESNLEHAENSIKLIQKHLKKSRLLFLPVYHGNLLKISRKHRLQAPGNTGKKEALASPLRAMVLRRGVMSWNDQNDPIYFFSFLSFPLSFLFLLFTTSIDIGIEHIHIIQYIHNRTL